MKTHKFLLLFVFLCTIHSNAQDPYGYYESLWDRNDIEISEIRKEVDSIVDIFIIRREFLNVIKISHEFSIECYKRKLYKDAIVYAEQEIALYRKLNLKNKKYVKALYNLGLFYSKKNDFEKAIIRHKEVVSLNFDRYSTAKAFCELGNCYGLTGDFFRSKNYYLQGISLLEKLDKNKLLIKKYIDFSHVLDKIGTKNSLDKKLEILDKANQLFTENPTIFSLRDYYSMNNDYANYYNSKATFDFDKAKYYYQRNLSEALQTNDSVIIYTSYTNFGNLYIDSKSEIQKDSAIYFLNQGLKYSRSNNERSGVYHQFSNYYIQKNQYEQALEYIQQFLVYSIHLDDTIGKLPKLEDLIKSNNKNNILLGLIRKATILLKLYENSKNIDHIRWALDNLLVADKLIDILLDNSTEEESKLYWRKEASEIYLKGIICSNILNRKETAFYLSEKKKALLLTADILENIDRVQFPEELINRQSILKKNILDLENLISKQKNKDSLNYLEQKHFSFKYAYQKQEDSLQLKFPEYYAHKTKTKTITLQEVQKTLSSETIIVSFISNEDLDDDDFSSLYAVVISNTDTEILKIGGLQEIETLVTNYRTLISKPFETEEELIQFRDIAFRLYAKLLPVGKIKMTLENKHLVIVPDGQLQYIPFESLVVDKLSNRYLIENNEISYAYSMSFLLHNKNIDRKPSKELVTFAPIDFNHDDLETISDSDDEIKGIQNSITGDSYDRSEASKSNFLHKTSDYKIIHLATHANFSENLQIAFHDTNLEYHELYTSKNQAELVVLSACNTSLGEMAKGEGVMSLARGFFYAGANTVISSLWNANDKSTSQIMENFYQNIDKGQTKSKALHNAKIKYLKSASLSDASPHYWATFVLIGDSETKLFPSNSLFYWIISLLLLVLIISVILSFIKKR